MNKTTEKLIDVEFIRKILPARKAESNKATYGRALSITGSKEYIGAGIIPPLSSLRAGCGYSCFCFPKSLFNVYAQRTSDLILKPYDDNNLGHLTENSVEDIKISIKTSDAVLIGCGLGLQEKTKSALFEILEYIKYCKIPCIIDADALNAIAESQTVSLLDNSLITPHPLEAQRLLGVSKDEILKNPVFFAKELSKKYQTNVILKTHKSVLCSKSGDVFVNTTGNSVLAKAGTGDVLAGMIVGFVAQGVSLIESGILATFLHGLAGEIYSESYSEYSMLASELVDFIPKAFKKIK